MKDKESTRNIVFDTALQLFAQKGYESVGVQEIVKESGVTKPTLYYYFGSKKGLLETILDKKGEPYFEAFQQAAAYNHDMEKTLTDLLEFQIEETKKNADFLRLHISLSASPADTEAYAVHKDLKDKIEGCIRSFFERSTNEIGNMKGFEKIYSRTFLNLTNSLAIDVMNKEIKMNEQTVYRIIHSFLYGIVS